MVGFMMPKYKLELYDSNIKGLVNAANNREKLKVWAEQAAIDRECDEIVLYEYRGMAKGYVKIAEGTKEEMLEKL
jgi:hypothetical protein